MQAHDNNPLCFVKSSIIHGHGLFARCDIPADTLIGHYDGAQTQENGTHVLWVEAGPDDDPSGRWIGYDGDNELRYLNHARPPNGQMDGLDLYALDDIQAGEEITIDYGEEFEVYT